MAHSFNNHGTPRFNHAGQLVAAGSFMHPAEQSAEAAAPEAAAEATDGSPEDAADAASEANDGEASGSPETGARRRRSQG